MNKRQRVTIDLSMEEDEEEEAFSEPVLSPSSNTNPPLQRRSSSPSSNVSASTLHTPRKVPANLFSYFKPSPASTSSPSPPAVPRTEEVKIEPSVAKLLPILPSQRSTPRSLVLKSGFKCSSTEFFSSLLQRRETASSAYHRHFLSMFEAVFNSLPFYHHLFDEKEFDLCRSVLSSSPKLQALLSRLVMRKGERAPAFASISNSCLVLRSLVPSNVMHEILRGGRWLVLSRVPTLRGGMDC